MPHGVQQYVKLEERLVLLAWLNRLFGYQSNRELLADLRESAEGSDAAGSSFVYHRIAARGDKVQVPSADLARYDHNIRTHLRAMNARRQEPITLRYFQQLATLYAEIFLDRYFHGRAEMLRSLNAFVAERNAARPAGESVQAEFAEADLRKLALWMATGSGKTLIMHLNYRQFLGYNTETLDNILLITPPGEALSEQHLAEMAAAGIPGRRFDLNESGLGLGARNAERVIEITKLVDVKRGGVSVPVEAFEGKFAYRLRVVEPAVLGAAFALLLFSKCRDRARVGRSERSERSRQPGVIRRPASTTMRWYCLGGSTEAPYRVHALARTGRPTAIPWQMERRAECNRICAISCGVFLFLDNGSSIIILFIQKPTFIAG